MSLSNTIRIHPVIPPSPMKTRLIIRPVNLSSSPSHHPVLSSSTINGSMSSIITPRRTNPLSSFSLLHRYNNPPETLKTTKLYCTREEEGGEVEDQSLSTDEGNTKDKKAKLVKTYRFLGAQYFLGAVILPFVFNSASTLTPPSFMQYFLQICSVLSYGIMCTTVFLPMYNAPTKSLVRFPILALLNILNPLFLGVALAMLEGRTRVAAIVATTALVSSLTGFTFWATRDGKDTYHSIIILFMIVFGGIVTVFARYILKLNPGPLQFALDTGLGILVFSGMLVLNTKRLFLEDPASVEYNIECFSISVNIYCIFTRVIEVVKMLAR